MHEKKPREGKGFRRRAKHCPVRDRNSQRGPGAQALRTGFMRRQPSAPASALALLPPRLPGCWACRFLSRSPPTACRLPPPMLSTTTLRIALLPFLDSSTCHLLSDFFREPQSFCCSLNSCHALLPANGPNKQLL